MAKQSLLLGTRKGVLVYERANGAWKLAREAFSGVDIPYAWHDARTGYVWATVHHGHFGPKLHRSGDGGVTWEEMTVPSFPEGAMIKEGTPATVKYLWMMAPAAPTGRRLYMGTEPGGLFSSDDDGRSWVLDEALWNQPSRPEGWFGAAAGTSEHPAIHSVLADPRDPRRVVVGISVGGVFETVDGGASWTPRNKGMRANHMPDPHGDIGHDPHLLTAAPSDPDVVWQQNHYSIFRSDDGGRTWNDVGQENGPARFGFAVAAHETRADTAWVVPAHSDERRVPIDRTLCVCRTEDGGRTWTPLRKGLPQKEAWDIVYRHALDRAGDTLAFGSTTGNAWFSDDGGDAWHELARHLPMISSVRFADL